MNSLEVRPAAGEDAEDISDILLTSFREFQSLYTPEGFAATTPTPAEILIRLSQGPIWIATLSGRKVGTVSVVLKGSDLYVRGMAVVPEARGAGVAVAMFELVDEYANAQECKRQFLSTTPFLDRAIAFYKSLGFTKIGDGPTDLFGTPLFTMERWL